MSDEPVLPENNLAPLPRIQEPRRLRRPCGCGKRESRIVREIPEGTGSGSVEPPPKEAA